MRLTNAASVQCTRLCCDRSSTRGAAPSIASLAEHAAPFDVAAVLADLDDGDFVCLDHDREITAAYPFSALPTRHLVRISESATVSPCARSTPLAYRR
jgi:hypothetical protein